MCQNKIIIKLRNRRSAQNGIKATFVMFDFGFKNLLKIERPTSENNISGIRAGI